MPTLRLIPSFQLPFLLPTTTRVLVAGCGDSFDLVYALPVALALLEAGHQVHLASYSALDMSPLLGLEQPVEGLYRVDRRAQPPAGQIAPVEVHMARWWHEEFSEDQTVWTFDRLGIRSLMQAYRFLQSSLRLEAVIVIDGGVGGLFIGNEYHLGTPSMDAASILAAASLNGCVGIFGMTGFGTEQPVRHADALLRMAELIDRGQMLGTAAAAPGSRVVTRFLQAVRYIQAATPDIPRSATTSSLEAAILGTYGDTANKAVNTAESVWVSPLTLLYWFFNLEGVAAAKPYRQEVMATDTHADMYNAIDRWRNRLGVLQRSDIPI